MKKVIVFFILVIVSLPSFTQITITTSDMPNVNDMFRISSTANIQGLDPMLTGPGFSWDFSTLISTTQQIDTFFSVSSTPLAYQFFFNNNIFYPNHKANYALRGIDIGIPQVPITEVFNYIKNSSSAYDNVGFGANISGVPSSTQNSPVDREYEFPMNYLDNHISNSDFAITVPTFGDYGQAMERIDIVDGWGSLILPNGTYTVLRVKSILNKIDTIYTTQPFPFGTTIARPQEIEYKWLAVGKGIPLLKIITIAGNVTQIEYKDDISVGVADLSKINNVTVFPNPTKSYLIIDFKALNAGNLTIKLKDILGKNLGSIYQHNITTGNNKVLINLAQHNVKKGIYFLEFEIDEKQYYTEKIVVVE
ncbi:MAG: T9SS type A sorting domain-containing protein [Flavobacteriales bacterium]|nr:T9SS type A sorting domain-containing protein [Flavobacteriales bacterium]